VERNVYDFDVQYLDGTLLKYCLVVKDQWVALPVLLAY